MRTEALVYASEALMPLLMKELQSVIPALHQLKEIDVEVAPDAFRVVV
jgi:hypothetical protein